MSGFSYWQTGMSAPRASTEQAALGGGLERVGVEAQVAEVVGELWWAVGAENFSRLDSPYGFDELIVIGVV